MSRTYDAIVVGAGITGASTAYHLKRGGMDKVALFERRRPAAGGTGKSAAIVRQHYSTALLARLTQESIGMFRDMPDEIGADSGYVRSGWCFLVPEPMIAAAGANVELLQSCGIDTRFLEPGEIADRMPWLNPHDVAGVVYEPEGGYADPVRTTEAYVKGFGDIGGSLHVNTPVRALLRTDDRVTGILTDDGPIEAGCVVNAAGPWSKHLAESAEIELDLRSVREQDTVWEVRNDRPIPGISISNAVDAIYLRPLGQRRFVVGRGFPKDYIDVDPYNYKETADEDFVSDVQTRLEHRFPPFAGARRIDSYAALYDVTPDWHPFIGPRSGLSGYCDACGGSGHGFKIGAAIGRRLARWTSENEVDEDFARLSYDRVTANKPFVGAYGGNRA